jgi:hypothetical protein
MFLECQGAQSAHLAQSQVKRVRMVRLRTPAPYPYIQPSSFKHQGAFQILVIFSTLPASFIVTA